MTFPTIPSPPTDNLYKFMALSGVALIIASAVFWAEFFTKQEQRFHETLRTMVDAQPPAAAIFARVHVESGTAVSSEQRQLVEHYRAAKEAADRVYGEFLVYEKLRRIVSAAAIAMAGGGIALSVSGFSLWYLRVQRPLDRVLDREAKTGK